MIGKSFFLGPGVGTKRSVINMNLATNNGEFAYIDNIRGGGQFGMSSGGSWHSGAVYGQNIDAQGWPAFSTSTLNRGVPFGGFVIPSSSQYTGNWQMDGFGSGTIQLFTSLGGTFSIVSSTGVTLAGSTFTVTDQGAGVRWTVTFTYSGTVDTVGVNMVTCDPAGTGKFIKKVRVYRASDAADLAAGKIFRAPWKQALRDLNPAAIRIMNWTGNSAAKLCRFEHRTLPSSPEWQPSYYSFEQGPRYGAASGTNQYTVTGVTGTPTSMQHGEIALCRIDNGIARDGGKTITAVSLGSNGRVTSSESHGFNTGDVIVHKFDTINVDAGVTAGSAVVNVGNSGKLATLAAGMLVLSNGVFPNGTTVLSTNTGAGTATFSQNSSINSGGVSLQCKPMPKFDGLPCTITVVDSTHYDTNANTTAMGGFNGSNAYGTQFITLQVGSGNDRTAYPVAIANEPQTPASTFGNFIQAGDYKAFYFDKYLSAQTDASGNPVYGVWLFYGQNNDIGHEGGTPLEAGPALINELMAMTRTDGGPTSPIDLWFCLPHRGLLSVDPDYSSGSNLATNSVNVLLNGSTVDGVTYAGLDSRCKLLLEHSNETWNFGTGFQSCRYLWRLGELRWGHSTSDSASMASIRSMLMVKDIIAAALNTSQVKFVMAGQGTTGLGDPNFGRLYGTSDVTTDSGWNASGTVPMSLHDYFAWAAYFTLNGSTFEANNLATIVASWLSHAGNAVAQEADCASYVAGMEDDVNGGSEIVKRYRDTLLPQYASALTAISNKSTIMYEGGWDRDVSNGSTDQNNFLIAAKRSQAWATKLAGFHSAFQSAVGALYPADYIMLDRRWGHEFDFAYDHAVGGVEWSGLDLAWQAIAIRNRS